MALHFQLCVNGQPIGGLAMQRITNIGLNPADPAAADVVSEYQVTLNGQPVTTVMHRYGDGPWALTSLACAATFAAQAASRP